MSLTALKWLFFGCAFPHLFC